MAGVSPSWDHELTVVEPDVGGSRLVRAMLAERATRDAAREEGLHYSTIVQDILKTMYPKRYRREFEQRETLLYQELGNVVEDLIAEGLKARSRTWEKPRSVRRDGIWCSPDGWEPPTRTIDEVKATWVSERDFFDSVKFHGYCMQALGYAYVWGAERIRFHVFFVNGSYPKGAPIPHPRTLVLRWASGAPERYWQMARQHARDRRWL